MKMRYLRALDKRRFAHRAYHVARGDLRADLYAGHEAQAFLFQYPAAARVERDGLRKA